MLNWSPDIEEDGKGIPVLLRQYLKLNGKILSFSVDKHFGDVLDCLILVDIFKTPERSIKRYLGKDAYEQLLPYMQREKEEEKAGGIIPQAFCVALPPILNGLAEVPVTWGRAEAVSAVISPMTVRGVSGKCSAASRAARSRSPGRKVTSNS